MGRGLRAILTRAMNPTPHLLIVDDDAEIGALLSKFLAGYGYRVSVAASGGAMTQLLADTRIDLVVLDIMLPGKDGLALCRELRAGGKDVLTHARRAVAELDAVKFAGKLNGTGAVGEVRLGIRMPPLGEAIRALLRGWRKNCGNVALTVSETNERDLAIALDERRLDALLAPRFMLPPHAASLTVCRDQLFAAVPEDHKLAGHPGPVTRRSLIGETILVQGWQECQGEREFLTLLLDTEACFQSHAASRQAILTLVAAGYGVAIVTESQAANCFAGVVFRPIDERRAVVQLGIAWRPETEEPAVGRFVAFIRDAVRSRGLV